MQITRTPGPGLLPYVSTLWVSRGRSESGRELVVPTGASHLVLRLDGPPLRIFDGATDGIGRVVGHAVVGGPRALPYLRAVGGESVTIGAQLRPGALPILGVDVAAVAGRHVALADLWRVNVVSDAFGRLAEMTDADRQLDQFEVWLATRLLLTHAPRAEISWALSQLAGGNRQVESIAADTGFSPRRFRAIFVEAVGMSPKRYARVARVQSCLASLRRAPQRSLAEISLDCGYGDQSHMNRDFAEIVGLSPHRYRQQRLDHSHHVPIRLTAIADFSKTSGSPRTRIAA